MQSQRLKNQRIISDKKSATSRVDLHCRNNITRKSAEVKRGRITKKGYKRGVGEKAKEWLSVLGPLRKKEEGRGNTLLYTVSGVRTLPMPRTRQLEIDRAMEKRTEADKWAL